MLVTLTVITPDEGETFPDWAYDMATAIVARDGVFDQRDLDGNGVADFIEKSRYEYGKPLPLYDWGSHTRDVMLLDWSAISHLPGSAVNPNLIQFYREGLQFRLQSRMVGTHDLHFIGHGRGAFVNQALLQMLVDQPTGYRLGHIQMTTLDPYSREDGNLLYNPGGLVDFTDNYYQTSGPRAGAPLEYALNFDLSERLAQWSGRTGDGSEHEEVHDWYHWTIASAEGAPVVNPPLADETLKVPSAADRAWLYDAYVADVNDDGQPDDFRHGARIGYYFTVNAGGLGNVLNVDRGELTYFFTFDVRTGELPLFLGRLVAEEAAQITYGPNSNLYVTGDDLQFGGTQLVFFDGFGPWRSVYELGEPWGPSAPFARRFSLNGRLAHASGDSLAEIDPQTAEVLVRLQLDWVGASNRTAAFDVHDDLYLLRVPESGGHSDLIRFDTSYLVPQTLGAVIPYDDVISTTAIDGMLYCFRAAGAYFSVNLTTMQVIERGQLALRAGDSLASVTSITSGTDARWHNRNARNDVTGDGRVNSSDVLAVINELLLYGARTISPYRNFSYYVDPTNDGRLNSSDVLSVINQILLGNAPAVEPAASLAKPAPASAPLPARQSPLDWIAFAAALDVDAEDDARLW